MFTDKQIKIIDAAGKILTSSGISGLTTKNLGKEMQVSESSIYRHFKSKEEIIVAMLDYLADQLEEKYTMGISKKEDPDEQLKQLFQLQFDYFSKYPHFAVAIFTDGLLEESENINISLLRIMRMKRDFLFPIIEAGRIQGIFTSAITNEQITHIIMGSVRLQMFKWRLSNFEFDIQKVGIDTVNALLELIHLKK
jgi:TetR/AcrR family transcriptional regulator, fatty acid metabolism regulator protein